MVDVFWKPFCLQAQTKYTQGALTKTRVKEVESTLSELGLEPFEASCVIKGIAFCSEWNDVELTSNDLQALAECFPTEVGCATWLYVMVTCISLYIHRCGDD